MQYIYHDMLLKDYIRSIIKNKDNTEYMYSLFRRRLKSIFLKNPHAHLDDEITKLLNDESIKGKLNQDIITKREKAKYYYKGQSLRKYLEENIKTAENLNYIYNYIFDKIKSSSKGDADLNTLIEEIISSKSIQDMLKSPTKLNNQDIKNWYYKDMLLIDYVRTLNIDESEVINVYNAIKRDINTNYPNISSEERKNKVYEYINSDKFKYYLKYGSKKVNYVYKGMLLIDYIRLNCLDDLSLNDKNEDNLYDHIVRWINKNYGYTSDPDENERFIDAYFKSHEYKLYLKNKKQDLKLYYIDNEYLLDYINDNYGTILKEHNKSPIHLYWHAMRYIKSHFESTKDKDKISEYIKVYFNSQIFKDYINKDRGENYLYYYQGEPLIKVIYEKYQSIIDDQDDLSRIYHNILFYIRSVKIFKSHLSMDELLSHFFENEYINHYKEELTRKKAIKNDVLKFRYLKEHISSEYLESYIEENELDINEYNLVNSKLNDPYASIVILEYAKRFNKNTQDVLEYTLNILAKEYLDENDLAWLIILGNKKYIESFLNLKKRYIYYYLNLYRMELFQNKFMPDEAEIYDLLYDLIDKKFYSLNREKEFYAKSLLNFIRSCIKNYFYSKRKTPAFLSLDDENKGLYNIICYEEDQDFSEDLYNILNDLDYVERRYISLRYGFLGEEYSIRGIQIVFKNDGINMNESELIDLEKNLLNKLKTNDNVISLLKKYS